MLITYYKFLFLYFNSKQGINEPTGMSIKSRVGYDFYCYIFSEGRLNNGYAERDE